MHLLEQISLVALLAQTVRCVSLVDILNYRTTTDNPNDWTGRWFPERPTTTAPQFAKVHYDRTMGITDLCDNGKTNIEKDYNGDYSAYLCMNPRNKLEPPPLIRPIIEYENIPKSYSAQHFCMNESIHYSTDVPTFGSHRQLWPVYGDYIYLPPQRWLHSLEHGGIVGLYHPCAHTREINLFKSLIQSCLWRHVISPMNSLPEDMPFTLVAWGVKLRMAHVSPSAMRDFIQKNALQGPEKVSRNGQFSELLLSPAKLLTDYEDRELCPGALAHD